MISLRDGRARLGSGGKCVATGGYVREKPDFESRAVPRHQCSSNPEGNSGRPSLHASDRPRASPRSASTGTLPELTP